MIYIKRSAHLIDSGTRGVLKDGEMWPDGRVACREGFVAEADKCPRPLRGYRHIHSHCLRTKKFLLQNAISDALWQEKEEEEEEEEEENPCVHTASSRAIATFTPTACQQSKSCFRTPSCMHCGRRSRRRRRRSVTNITKGGIDATKCPCTTHISDKEAQGRPC